MSLIELQEVVKTYGSVKALRGLNLSIPEGCLYGLLGPNGSGKTTTLRILSTLLEPDSGQVHVAGFNVLGNPRAVRTRLGFVAQDIALDKILTGRELLQLQGDLYHLRSSVKDLRIAELTARLDMDSWIDRRCGSYSGGMKRRLDLAAGLLHQPKVLVLDEPTVGLDIESRTTIWNLLRELKSLGTTILLSSHYLEEVDVLADRMAIMDNGRVIAEGTPADLKKELGGDRITLRVQEFSDENESEEVRSLLSSINEVSHVVINRSQGFSLNLVVDDQNVLPLIRQCLERAGFSIFSLSQSRPSLDDVYLRSTGKTLMDAELELAGKRDVKLESKKAMR